MRRSATSLVFLAVLMTLTAQAANKPKASTKMAHVWTAAEGEWMALPDVFPAGGQMKVMHGNPGTGPADIYFHFPAGYGVPWHFHTPTEKLMMQTGTMHFDMKSGTTDMTAGSYMFVPSRSPHAAKCVSTTDCYFYLSSSAPFDINLIDEKWNVTRTWSAAAPKPAAK